MCIHYSAQFKKWHNLYLWNLSVHLPASFPVFSPLRGESCHFLPYHSFACHHSFTKYVSICKQHFVQIYVYLMYIYYKYLSLMAQMVKNLTAMQETQVWFLGQEDPLQKEKATHSSILAWRSSWTEEPGGLQSMGLQRVRHDWSDLACRKITKTKNSPKVHEKMKMIHNKTSTYWKRGNRGGIEEQNTESYRK